MGEPLIILLVRDGQPNSEMRIWKRVDFLPALHMTFIAWIISIYARKRPYDGADTSTLGMPETSSNSVSFER
jgi:hypothetical protein